MTGLNKFLPLDGFIYCSNLQNTASDQNKRIDQAPSVRTNRIKERRRQRRQERGTEGGIQSSWDNVFSEAQSPKLSCKAIRPFVQVLVYSSLKVWEEKWRDDILNKELFIFFTQTSSFCVSFSNQSYHYQSILRTYTLKDPSLGRSKKFMAISSSMSRTFFKLCLQPPFQTNLL